jgi:small subunit ribosomal protein S5
VVGDRNGRVGAGYGKANQVPPAIEKAQKIAKRNMRPFPMQGRTIPHQVEGRFGACLVRLVPASPGTGVIAGASVRAVLEMFGLQDCLTKSYGSNNPKNLVKAVINGLSKLQSKDDIEQLRGVTLGSTEVEDMILRGSTFTAAPEVADESASSVAEDAGEPAATAVAEAPKAEAANTPKPKAETETEQTPKESPAE